MLRAEQCIIMRTLFSTFTSSSFQNPSIKEWYFLFSKFKRLQLTFLELFLRFSYQLVKNSYRSWTRLFGSTSLAYSYTNMKKWCLSWRPSAVRAWTKARWSVLRIFTISSPVLEILLVCFWLFSRALVVSLYIVIVLVMLSLPLSLSLSLSFSHFPSLELNL